MTNVSTGTKVIDGDGHIFEDFDAIAGFIPKMYRHPMKQEQMNSRIFPPLDHLHGSRESVSPAGLSGRGRDIGPEEWMAFLDEAKIDTTVLYPTAALAYGKIVSIDWAVAATTAYNDWLSETYLKRDSRFRGMALIPGQDPAAAVIELRRAVEELGMSGAMLPSNGFDTDLGSPIYWPIFEEADRLGCAISVHGGCHDGLGMDRLNRYAPVHALGHPLGVMISFASIIFNGVMDHYPNAKYAFLEGGVAWVLMALERFDRSHETHMEFDPLKRWGPQIGEKVSDYIIRHAQEDRLFIGIEGDEPLLPTAIEVLGAQSFVFSSDFPHEVSNEMIKEELDGIRTNEQLTTSARDALLRGSAASLYRL
jgi:predicted TIM-barrel fold metal-dependent hydrolase